MLLHSGVEILELLVSIRVLAALARFAIALETVAEFAQQLGDHIRRDVVLHVFQGGAQLVEALGCPQQRRHRIAPRRSFEELLQIAEKRRIRLGLGPAAPPWRRTRPAPAERFSSSRHFCD